MGLWMYLKIGHIHRLYTRRGEGTPTYVGFGNDYFYDYNRYYLYKR